MIDTKLLGRMLEEAAYVVPYVSESDLAGAIDSHAKAFGHVDRDRLAAAYSQWVSDQSEDKPPKTLPFVGTIRRILDGAPQGSTPATSPGWADEWPEVDADFLAPHRMFHAWARDLTMRHQVAHLDHPDNLVVANCPGCANEEQRAAIRELVHDKLDMLPEPKQLRTHGCRCAGNGLVYQQPDGTFAALPAADRRQADRMPPTVPCPDCNRIGHDAWMGYDQARGSVKAS